jgi:hypothetical protein
MNATVLIGSAAIKYHFKDFNREPKDMDFAVPSEHVAQITRQVYTENPKFDGIKIEALVNPVICNWTDDIILNPNLLLTLKMSHLFWDINWDKHMYDVQFLLSKGAKYNKYAFYDLYDYWTKYHGKNKRSDLKMSAADFFDNALKEFDHDYLHTLINPTPTYLNMLADNAEVEIDERKFEQASDEAKENLVREEVSVMAFERFRKLGYKKANLRMLKKYIISHVPLFAAPFVIENYVKLLKPKYDFIKVIEEKL